MVRLSRCLNLASDTVPRSLRYSIEGVWGLESNQRSYSGEHWRNAELLCSENSSGLSVVALHLGLNGSPPNEIRQQRDLKCGNGLGNHHAPLRSTVVDVRENA